ncbi:uncharacterized protein BDFB_004851, partial [Asbolus verrucosus]
IIAHSEVFGQPVFLSDKSVQCYERDCPSGTTACKKAVQTSDDKKTLSTVISCLDAQDMVLKDYIENSPNPFGPSTYFQSTSFSGTYSSHGQPVDININNNVKPQVEDFS